MKTLKTEEETASHLILDLSMQIQGASFGRCAQTSDKKGFAAAAGRLYTFTPKNKQTVTIVKGFTPQKIELDSASDRYTYIIYFHLNMLSSLFSMVKSTLNLAIL